MAQKNMVFWCSVKRRTCDTSSLMCSDCPKKAKDNRPSRSRRGYNSEWYRIRKEVLEEYGIPRDHWPLYDVDHNPPYDPKVEPDHRRYSLVPMLRSDHSRKTVKEDMKRDGDGKFVKKK